MVNLFVTGLMLWASAWDASRAGPKLGMESDDSDLSLPINAEHGHTYSSLVLVRWSHEKPRIVCDSRNLRENSEFTNVENFAATWS